VAGALPGVAPSGEPAWPVPRRYLPGVAGRRPAGLIGDLSRVNAGSVWLTVARSRSMLALGMALRCDVLHTLTVDGLSVVRYQAGTVLPVASQPAVYVTGLVDDYGR